MSEFEKRKGGARLEKNERPKHSRKVNIRKTVILVLIFLLALMLVGFAIYRAWAKPPEIAEPPVQDNESETNNAGNGDESTGNRKKDFYTFLVVGRDTGGGGNTDTILLAAYDLPNQKLNVMSIPRDTMVNIPYDIKRINAVYNYAGGGEEGIQALYDEVSQLVGFVPDFEVVVEWKAVGELVDAIGGVWFDVPRNMDFWDPTQNLRIDIDKGYQFLDGEKAMGVIRWRQNNDGTGYVNGDIGRIATQQAFLKTVVAQCLKIENVTRIKELAKVFTDNVQTDLTLGNLVWFAEQAIFGGLSMENVNFITLPGNYDARAWCRHYKNYQSYVLPDAEALLAVINENFNPYLAERTMTGLDIMSLNADGSLSSTTGVVEDTKAALPPVIPEPKPEPEPAPEVTDQPEPPVDPELPVDPEQPEDPGVTEDPEVGGEPEVPLEPGTEQEPIPTEDPTEGEQPEPEPTPEQDDEVLTEETPVLPPLNAAA